MKTKRLGKTLLSLLLCMSLICGILPLTGTVFAAADTDVWDGTSVATGFDGGDGSKTDPYQIATGAQLAYLSEQVNSRITDYEGTHFLLTADLDLNHKGWVPIGIIEAFRGALDGDGHTVSNYRVLGKQEKNTCHRQGLFSTFRGEYIKNLTVSDVEIMDTDNASTAYYVGGLAGVIYDDATVENCHAKNITINVCVFSAGGLIGDIVGDGAAAFPAEGGRLFGCTTENITIEPDGVMAKAANCGGLVGNISAIKAGSAYTLENCSASGSIKTELDTGWGGDDWGGIGGLVGAMMGGQYNSASDTTIKVNDFLIRDCHASVIVAAPNLGGVGGLFGEASYLKMENCSASGDVTGTWATGGLIGTGAGSTFTGCYATGNVTANDWHTGGLIGYGVQSTLTGCFATGDVSVTNKWVGRAGGLVGNGFGCIMKDCYSSGDVISQMGDVGGLVGWVTDNDSKATAGRFTNCFAFGKVRESESDDMEYAKPLVNNIWDGDNPDGAKVVNCYYSSQISGKKDTNGEDYTPEQFADGTVAELLGDAFVQRTDFPHPVLASMYQSDMATLKSLSYSINDGDPIPVPDFAADGDFYTVSLPRSTPRDAVITLTGVCAEKNAVIAENTGVTLVHGAAMDPAGITVKAQDGTTKDYTLYFETEQIAADLKDAAIGGIEGKTFAQSETPAFTASGAGMDDSSPAMGDQRYRPVSWKIDDGAVLSGSFTQAPFTGTLDLGKLAAGTHTLTVDHVWEQYGELFENDDPTGEYGWSPVPLDEPEAFAKTVSFTVAPVTYALTVVGGNDITGAGPYEKGAVITLRAHEPAQGYMFDKWERTSGAGTFQDAFKTETAFTMGDSDTVVTATYKKVEAPVLYTLTFDAAGGAPVPPAQTLKEGDRPAAVEQPKKDGYTFLGWYDGETKVDAETFHMPANPVTLTAKWEKQQDAPIDIPATGGEFPAWAVWLLAWSGGGALITWKSLWSRRKHP